MSLATATHTEAAAATSPIRWVVLALAAATVFSDYYEADALGPIADLLIRQRHFSQFQIGDLTAVISLPGIPLAVFNGLLIDRYGPVRVTFWSALIGFVGAIQGCREGGIFFLRLRILFPRVVRIIAEKEKGAWLARK